MGRKVKCLLGRPKRNEKFTAGGTTIEREDNKNSFNYHDSSISELNLLHDVIADKALTLVRQKADYDCTNTHRSTRQLVTSKVI